MQVARRFPAAPYKAACKEILVDQQKLCLKKVLVMSEPNIYMACEKNGMVS